MIYEDWLREYYKDNDTWEWEDMEEAFNAGFQAGIEYVRQGGSFK